MPVMDGLDATRLITERNKDQIVVFVTAHALDEFRSKAHGAAGGKGLRLSYVAYSFARQRRASSVDRLNTKWPLIFSERTPRSFIFTAKQECAKN